MTRLTVLSFELAELLQRFCSSWEIIISVCLWGFASVICRLVFGAFTYVLDALFLTVIRLAEGGQALATFGLVFFTPTREKDAPSVDQWVTGPWILTCPLDEGWLQ